MSEEEVAGYIDELSNIIMRLEAVVIDMSDSSRRQLERELMNKRCQMQLELAA